MRRTTNPRKIKLTCEACGKNFDVCPSQAEGRRFCSKPCFLSNHTRREPVTCGHCEKSFAAYPHRAKTQRFCSRECRWAGCRTRQISTNRCPQCGCEFTESRDVVRKFCSRECQAKAASERQSTGQTLPCLECGREVYVSPNRVASFKFCSKACKAKEKIGCTCITCGADFTCRVASPSSRDFCSKACKNPEPCRGCGVLMIGGAVNDPSRKQRKYCTLECYRENKSPARLDTNYVTLGFIESVKQHGRVLCNRCGLDNLNALVVHHRDSNRSNNSPSNLETLCASCHLIEHTRGRDSARVRRAENAMRLVAEQSAP